MTANDAAFRALAKAFANDPRVSPPGDERGRFGSNGFKVDGKIFAMSVAGALVVKLPKVEIDAIVAEGRGERLTMGKGRVMKEWLVVREPPAKWRAIVTRARLFVGDGDMRGRAVPRAVDKRVKARTSR
jgi:hypothetical protein